MLLLQLLNARSVIKPPKMRLIDSVELQGEKWRLSESDQKLVYTYIVNLLNKTQNYDICKKNILVSQTSTKRISTVFYEN